jgi:peptidoglycan/xylan/chitin deacetylase (PgdA/CDA1 family)
MFSANPFYGTSLPEKVLCLTFDDGPGETDGDGPGPKTLRLATYLSDQGISATFFMVGRHIMQYPHILPAMEKLGHLIGNHTFHHSRPLPELLAEGSDIASEIRMTDDLIKAYNPGNNIYFRAPWGSWNGAVAAELNKKVDNGIDHIGPFYWDIDGSDWFYWRDHRSAEKCAKAYLRKIKEIGRGILLFHDSTADIAEARLNNRTFELMRILIPRLRKLGYTFIRLDEVPGIQAHKNSLKIT